MDTPVPDHAAREQAIDPALSCIVQAPAGSGKTALLTHRFLRLLSRVQKPEHIVAITFTKKAASEMKARILYALRQAHDLTIVPQSAHAARLMADARKALAQDTAYQWDLLQQPHRLRIMTIDAWCHMLARAIPLFEKELPFAEISDTAHTLYHEAARNTLHDALHTADYTEAIQSLLLHVDNQESLLISLLIQLLHTRDQWLEVILSAQGMAREQFEATLQYINDHTLARFLQATPTDLQDTLCTLSRQAAQSENDAQSPRNALQSWERFDALTREQAQALGALWLTKDQNLRKSFDHHVGIRKTSCAPQLYAHIKKSSQDLSLALSEQPEWCALLSLIQKIPHPHYDAQQWHTLQALLHILPLLAAQLHLVFQKNNALDFSAVTTQAIMALGDEENPSDLTLHLDYTLHHLLIDEFQDTSLQQMRLLTRLTQGFDTEAGRSLFLVGDPMQSIYRFRQAEVGLFLKAQQEGIGHIRLTPLQLTCNFRSHHTIIDWINHHFAGIFPRQADIPSGAIPFHPAIAMTTPYSDDMHAFIHAWQCSDTTQEAEYLATQIQGLLETCPDDSIAILVRSRTQLGNIIPCLRKHHIAYQGVDIEKLAQLPHVRDLWILTQALLFPTHNLTWLAFLRSPWCGLDMASLLSIAGYAAQRSIYISLPDAPPIPGLSESTYSRLRYVHTIMAQAIQRRCQQSLTASVQETAQKLQAAILYAPREREDWEPLYQLLDRYESLGQLHDITGFEKALEALYSQKAQTSNLHIMTIHKSKGLEFDTVILPGLGSKPKAHDKPLLRWHRIPTQHEDALLLSPMHPVTQKDDPLFQYIGEIEKEKSRYEDQRLFYVAATRAKKRLILCDHHTRHITGSLRALLATQIFTEVSTSSHDATDTKAASPPPYVLQHSKLPDAYYMAPPPITHETGEHPVLNPLAGMARIQGIIAHEILQWICTYHPETAPYIPVALLDLRIRQAGFDHTTALTFSKKLHTQIAAMHADPHGAWICKAQKNEKNEYALLTYRAGRAHTIIMDRIFEENGIQWIIDFKTSSTPDTQIDIHRKQLQQYADIMRQHTALPVRCGIFYLETCQWVALT